MSDRGSDLDEASRSFFEAAVNDWVVYLQSRTPHKFKDWQLCDGVSNNKKNSCLSEFDNYFYKGNKQFGVYRDLKIHKVSEWGYAKILSIFSPWLMAYISGYIHKWDIASSGNALG